MKDNFGREIEYLRISVTKRCNLNCSYCGSKKDGTADEMTADEIVALVTAFSEKGIKKVRLTGGEPLMRRDIADIARRIKNIPGISSLFITTNGILLGKYAIALREAGVDGVNISLDTLNPVLYKEITGVDRLEDVLSSLNTCLEAGFSSVKTNTVLVKGRNDGEALSLMKLSKDKNVDVRFIELMPFSKEGENKELMVSTSELLSRFSFLEKINASDKGAAKYYTAEGYLGRIGFISPRTEKFCSDCNRIRVLADGKIRPCLASNDVFDVREFIFDKEKLLRIIEKAILSKPLSHHFEDGEIFRGLNLIGG